jgi:hypothetical protein
VCCGWLASGWVKGVSVLMIPPQVVEAETALCPIRPRCSVFSAV